MRDVSLGVAFRCSASEAEHLAAFVKELDSAAGEDRELDAEDPPVRRAVIFCREDSRSAEVDSLPVACPFVDKGVAVGDRTSAHR